MADKEIEIVGLAALGDWLKGEEDAPPEGAKCANCDTPLQGPFCHKCGQVADDHHRSIWELGKEAFVGAFNVDSKLVRTIPRLLFNPARLTNEYLAGRRARQVPPLRMFLVVVLLFFLTGGEGSRDLVVADRPVSAGPTGFQVNVGKPPPPEVRQQPVDLSVGSGPVAEWINPRVKYAMTHQDDFAQSLKEWPHRIAILLMPMGALILGVMYVFNRRFYLFDHLIFSMHSLSFMGLLASAGALIGNVKGMGPVVVLLFLAAPAHLFMHMRGVYGSGVIPTLLRMLFLFFATLVGFLALVVLAVAAGLSTMPGGSS